MQGDALAGQDATDVVAEGADGVRLAVDGEGDLPGRREVPDRGRCQGDRDGADEAVEPGLAGDDVGKGGLGLCEEAHAAPMFEVPGPRGAFAGAAPRAHLGQRPRIRGVPLPANSTRPCHC